jgi:hypothetical protein
VVTSQTGCDQSAGRRLILFFWLVVGLLKGAGRVARAFFISDLKKIRGKIAPVAGLCSFPLRKGDKDSSYAPALLMRLWTDV